MRSVDKFIFCRTDLAAAGDFHKNRATFLTSDRFI